MAEPFTIEIPGYPDLNWEEITPADERALRKLFKEVLAFKSKNLAEKAGSDWNRITKERQEKYEGQAREIYLTFHGAPIDRTLLYRAWVSDLLRSVPRFSQKESKQPSGGYHVALLWHATHKEVFTQSGKKTRPSRELVAVSVLCKGNEPKSADIFWCKHPQFDMAQFRDAELELLKCSKYDHIYAPLHKENKEGRDFAKTLHLRQQHNPPQTVTYASHAPAR